VMRELDEFILAERQDNAMKEDAFEIQEKTVEPMVVAGIRMKGKYSDCGKEFGRIGKMMGRFISGKPLMLHYDEEFKEEDADFEACMPVKRGEGVEGIVVRELGGVRCVTLMHRGPYEEMGRSYAKVLKYVKERGYGIVMPTREVYVKGPGMIFKGNPRNYLTEIQIPVEVGVGKSKS
jgi:effector-binding domain-containing protein